MWNEAMQVVISNGVFAILFVGLLVYQIKDSKAREVKYQNTIDKLASHLEVIKDIQEDLVEIKKAVIFGRKGEKQKNEIKRQIEVV